MEAMKMENPIKAPQAGVVSKVAVTEGQAVETGADLVQLGE
jgi:biotin carboxyl carrier protein